MNRNDQLETLEMRVWRETLLKVIEVTTAQPSVGSMMEITSLASAVRCADEATAAFLASFPVPAAPADDAERIARETRQAQSLFTPREFVAREQR